MQQLSFDTREEWLQFREGKITGSIANDVYVVKKATSETITSVLDRLKIEYKKSARKDELLSLIPEEHKSEIADKVEKKLAYYQLMADRLAVKDGEIYGETPLDRGTRLEEEAIAAFAKKAKKKISNHLVVWVSDAHPSITYSPDGIITTSEVVETKCLSSAMHLYIYFEKDIPAEYQRQNIQAFIANEKLKKLHFVCYDPRIPCLPLHYITINREDIADQIEAHKNYQLAVLKMLEEDVISLSF